MIFHFLKPLNKCSINVKFNRYFEPGLFCLNGFLVILELEQECILINNIGRQGGTYKYGTFPGGNGSISDKGSSTRLNDIVTHRYLF